MGHMQPEIYHGKAWLVETYNGTEVVPDDLVNMPDVIDEHNYTEAAKELQTYCEGAIIDVPDFAIEGWLCRLSAPGYLDCTPWSLFETKHEAIDWTREMGADESDF